MRPGFFYLTKNAALNLEVPLRKEAAAGVSNKSLPTFSRIDIIAVRVIGSECRLEIVPVFLGECKIWGN